ncbi:hypothetical protein WICMUC_002282 [Wickerhamomyces mucosus]|uniref:holo-[acyl-carrier-protein] synthase n=1 Tax=Wickerhamomyces mucosus TaxID=1378264 RepID=A0A9P8PPT0_9ASCO|nr:hypothetical protein WICMUC_002282 [Wickerhamomyces mucosus]
MTTIRFSSDSKTSLSNQLLQRFISCIYRNTTDITKVEFEYNKFGKPSLVDTNLCFSMSNQQGYTSMIINTDMKEVGIDLASIKDLNKFGNNYLDNFAEIFHENEYKYLSKYDNYELKVIFTEFWALKESYAKKLGVGLNADLQSFDFRNVHLVNYKTSRELKNYLEIQKSQWNSSATLYIYDNLEKDLNIFLNRLNPDIVVSVIGESIDQPLIVKIPIDTILEYFQ